MSDNQSWYDKGGYLPAVTSTRIAPGECIGAKRGDTFVCVREHDHGSKR